MGVGGGGGGVCVVCVRACVVCVRVCVLVVVVCVCGGGGGGGRRKKCMCCRGGGSRDCIMLSQSIAWAGRSVLQRAHSHPTSLPLRPQCPLRRSRIVCLPLLAPTPLPPRSWPASREAWTARPARRRRPRRCRRSRCGRLGPSPWQVRAAAAAAAAAAGCVHGAWGLMGRLAPGAGIRASARAEELTPCVPRPTPSPAHSSAGVRHSYLWLADCLGRPFLVSLRHPGLRLRCLAARGEITTARTIAERGEQGCIDGRGRRGRAGQGRAGSRGIEVRGIGVRGRRGWLRVWALCVAACKADPVVLLNRLPACSPVCFPPAAGLSAVFHDEVARFLAAMSPQEGVREALALPGLTPPAEMALSIRLVGGRGRRGGATGGSPVAGVRPACESCWFGWLKSLWAAAACVGCGRLSTDVRVWPPPAQERQLGPCRPLLPGAGPGGQRQGAAAGGRGRGRGRDLITSVQTFCGWQGKGSACCCRCCCCCCSVSHLGCHWLSSQRSTSPLRRSRVYPSTCAALC